MKIETMTRAEAGSEIKKLADLANDKDRKWTTADEARWDEANEHYNSFDESGSGHQLGRRDAIPRDAPAWARAAFGGEPAGYEHYRDMRTGRSVPAVKRDQSFANATSGFGNADADRFDGLGLGGALRALALGVESDAERRALSEGSDGAGGFTVPTVLSSRLIDKMRAKSRVVQAGAVTLPIDSDAHDFAKLIADPSPAWRGEGDPVGESDPTFASVRFAPKSLAVMVRVSEELLQDSLNVESALQNSLANALALELDRVALFGTGASNEPLGLDGMSNVNSISMGVNGAAVSDFAPVLDAVESLQEANGGNATAAIMSPRTQRAFSGLTDSTGQPLRRPEAISAMRFLETTKVPTDLVQGTSSNASSILLGDYGNLVIGVRQRLRIETLKELFRGSLQVGFIAHLRADIQAWDETAFAKIVGVTP